MKVRINRVHALLLALLSLLAAARGVPGQTTTATVEGKVRDPSGAVVAGARVTASAASVGAEREAATDEDGFYRIAALPAGTYTLTVSGAGFSARTFEAVELTVNRTVTLDVELEVGGVRERVDVSAAEQLIDPTASATGATVTPRQIVELPVNGRDYLDLLQLVPGVAVNRQADPGSDEATPALGERGGNTNFLIDGLPNKDNVDGGPAAQFNQETIAEFQVLTSGYKAEFGQASGAVVNVITKSGGDDYHGVASLFHRNNAFDASNSLDEAVDDAPFLLRWDYSLALGGPVLKEKVYFFASAERITESRRLNFVFPTATPQVVRDFETGFDNPSRQSETRAFLRLDEELGRHHLSQQVNYTNGNTREFLPLSQSTSLPSARNDMGFRTLLLGFADTALLGDRDRPWILTLRGGYRGEPSDTRPSHPDAGPGTTFNIFDSLTTGQVFGNLGSVDFGNPFTASNLDEQYGFASANAAKLFGRHDVKFGWNFLRTVVDGVESNLLRSQLFATLDDFAAFGPINSGFFTVTTYGGLTPEANEIHLRNNNNGLFVQDDWKVGGRLTLNLGLRWDHDSAFPSKRNFSPRLGAAWEVTPKTIVRGHFGVFYDQFRLGLVRDIPPFGGADLRIVQPFSYPRLFYGVPTIAPILTGLCLSPTLTDAQIASGGATCPFGPIPFIGVDRLNRVVAPGHAPIPADAVVNVSNVQALTGLSPDQYLALATEALGFPAGSFFWGPFGALAQAVIPPSEFPITVDPDFRTPHTFGFGVGVQRELADDLVVEADYYHREMRNVLGTRETNLAFESRLPGHELTYLEPRTEGGIMQFGPWFEGTYDGITVAFTKRFSHHYQLGGYYAWARARDNSLGILTTPSDNFIGVVPVVTDDTTGQTNAGGSFTAGNGHFIAAAGTFLNGPDLDEGPSDLAVDHAFQLNGLVELPWEFQVSGIFRAQSGFHFSRLPVALEDPDGNFFFNEIDHGPGAGRNQFTSPPFVNMDLRVSKRFRVGDRVTVQALVEFFNLFNNANPAAVETAEGRPISFGSASQVLPGREGQVGLRIEF